MKKEIMAVIIVAVIAAAAVVVAAPLALAGSWTVKIATITFSENIDTSLRPQVAFGSANEYYWVATAHDYYYTMRSGGSVTTNNVRVNSAAGNFSGFISWFLSGPTNQTVSQGNYTFSAPFGNHTHTFTFSSDQGIRDSGMYRLTLLLSGSATAAGSSPATVANDMRYAWNVP
jgi:hypothetical protein